MSALPGGRLICVICGSQSQVCSPPSFPRQAPLSAACAEEVYIYDL